jgi:hypothetical protein
MAGVALARDSVGLDAVIVCVLTGRTCHAVTLCVHGHDACGLSEFASTKIVCGTVQTSLCAEHQKHLETRGLRVWCSFSYREKRSCPKVHGLDQEGGASNPCSQGAQYPCSQGETCRMRGPRHANARCSPHPTYASSVGYASPRSRKCSASLGCNHSYSSPEYVSGVSRGCA